MAKVGHFFLSNINHPITHRYKNIKNLQQNIIGLQEAGVLEFNQQCQTTSNENGNNGNYF